MIYKDIEDIYNHLVDEESKYIFNCRLRYSIDNNERQFCNCIQEYYKDWLPVDELLKDAVLSKRKTIIFGYGVYGKRLRDELQFWGGEFECFCDNAILEYTTNEDKVLSVDSAVLKYKKDAIWCISSSKYVNEMFNDLIDRGIDANDIVIPKYGMAIASRGNQYFDMFPPEDEEVFVDCGAYGGDTIDAFLEWTSNKYKKIYSLEPSKRNFNKLISKYRNDKRIILINAAVWSKAEKICMNEHEAGTTVGNKGSEYIDGIDIDSLEIKERISYIKMDIEGSEMNALQGCKKTIGRYKPRLAICVYHKPEDIIDIPRQILEWRDDYKFSLRHYCSYWWETVLYAF